MSHRFGRMPFAAEMNPLQGEVGSEQGLMTGRKPEYGAIVANSREDAMARARLPANPGDQSFFKKRQSEANIDDKTIPPKPDWLSVFLRATLTSSGSSTQAFSAGHQVQPTCRSCGIHGSVWPIGAASGGHRG